MKETDKNHKKKPIVKVTTMYGKVVIYDDEPSDKDKEN